MLRIIDEFHDGVKYVLQMILHAGATILRVAADVKVGDPRRAPARQHPDKPLVNPRSQRAVAELRLVTLIPATGRIRLFQRRIAPEIPSGHPR
jgi:hypothetical protein